MNIYNRLAKDKLTPNANRSLLSLIMGEICVDGKPMNDNDAVKRLTQMVKVCNKNIDLYKNAGNNKASLDESVFCGIIEEYLPQGATEKDIEMAIVALDVSKEMKSMGKVMGYLKSNFQVVDGNLVKSILMG